ncbi:adenylate/guanylate cyclase domain-containing protein [Pseudodonghicola sp. IC7]|uniref:Adenylate/guanylate cyclase domain-containing protein n=2 Tax=Pseudodonghicola flavimaris TaxID=3050036 RepID=A0ABT7EWU7_9RHOB|nr:adenylate/guanylate cyclase domain-containing protein [Pseudodonghicola flavimaris]MDK3016816.1 adenylate/guanylate cyclase domain-containing protein [Pseudodonghicola flavimaris]
MPQTKYAEAALERHKREGLELAVRMRWITMPLLGVFVVIINPHWDVVFYHAILALLVLNGWLLHRVGRVGQSRLEMALILADLTLMTIGMVVPNPLSDETQPLAMQYWYDNFLYFFIILAAGTLAFSWRTVIAMGVWTGALWGLALAVAWAVATPYPGLTEAAQAAFGADPELAARLDPNAFHFRLRLQEVVVFLIVAVTLGFSARRFDRLLLDNAGLERERANLSRYFSPNVVEELSQNDEPLKQVRRQDIAVLFIDIVNFTGFAADRDPYEVIGVLREFHARMEREVFRHGGTLDKYLGDGLMATFGTPVADGCEAANALDCARAMIGAMDRWNRLRQRFGEPEIHAGIGVHYGTAVLGDIGNDRLEFAVIGTAVNVASRLEAMTRPLSARLIISDALRDRVLDQTSGAANGVDSALEGFTRLPDQPVRGLEIPLTIWALY